MISVSAQNATSSVAQSASEDARRAVTEIKNLRVDIEKLLMITEALWDIVKDQNGYTDEELLQRVRQIDLSDGKLDGKVAKSLPQDCPNCQRPMSRNRPICLYCGAPVNQALFDR